MKATLPENEPERLATLRQGLGILDTPPETRVRLCEIGVVGVCAA